MNIHTMHPQPAEHPSKAKSNRASAHLNMNPAQHIIKNKNTNKNSIQIIDKISIY